MPPESNKQIVRRFIDELWNGRKLEVADELFAPDCVTHQLRSGEPDSSTPRPPQHMKEHVAGWLVAFPDLQMTAEGMLAEGDMVATSMVFQGTHLGTWSGVPPTGRRVSIRMVVVHRIADGKICEDWALVESLGFLQQLGLAPSTADMIAKAASRGNSAAQQVS
ncbi:MAG TPA: ester cyclase [Candidatus Acidoferrales bacterium]|nr:ester cyclase [Candidatus Acidoferrales bacterium]